MSQPVKILVVDDEAAIRDSLGSFLEDYSFEVTTADSGERALELIDQDTFRVVIVDLRLPGISGDQLILKASVLSPKTGFLIHTGSVDFTLTEELRRVGMRGGHVLKKPQSGLDIFISTITNLLQEN